MNIKLSEYAKIKGKDSGYCRHLAAAGRFKTAFKCGGVWYISIDEPYPDNRFKHGKYVHWRSKYPSKY